jgi:hypothetical protein
MESRHVRRATWSVPRATRYVVGATCDVRQAEPADRTAHVNYRSPNPAGTVSVMLCFESALLRADAFVSSPFA